MRLQCDLSWGCVIRRLERGWIHSYGWAKVPCPQRVWSERAGRDPHDAFYHPDTEVTLHHQGQILLPTQTNTDRMWEGHGGA